MEKYPIKKVVITGASGGVGIALINMLISQKVEILILQKRKSERTKNIPNSHLVKIVECNLEELSTYIPVGEPDDVFFHLGWTNTNKMMRNNLEAQQENVIYACDAVRLAKKMGCHTFIASGSQAEYGRQNVELSDKVLCRPETAYGIMKLCACHATRMLCEEVEIRHIWTRILSGYGKYDNPNSMLVSTILKSIRGERLQFTKGEQIWDFVYLDDIANALILLAQRGKHGQIYPIGSGQPKKLREYIEIMCRKLGKFEEVEFGAIPYSDKEVMYLVADVSKICKDTGWSPKVDFDEGIMRTIEFYTKREKNEKMH